jgi:hypothetical protein
LGVKLSGELRALLEQNLTSIDQVEIVLLLMREPTRSWTAPEVAAALRMAPEAAAMRLFLLASAGIITFEAKGVPRYRYAVSDEPQDLLLRELAELYEKDPGALAAAVNVSPPDPVRSFADAFKLKK